MRLLVKWQSFSWSDISYLEEAKNGVENFLLFVFAVEYSNDIVYFFFGERNKAIVCFVCVTSLYLA